MNVDASKLVDRPEEWPVARREVLAPGRVISMVRDTVETPEGDRMVRDWTQHPGAVSVLAIDDEDRVVLVQQYRHPVGFRMVELPAGLLDVDGEDYLAAAQRELAEEADLQASHWRVLLDIMSTPGSCAESVRIFVATGLSAAPKPEGFTAEHEEADMVTFRVPRREIVAAVLAGWVQNVQLAAGVMAYTTALAERLPLRAPDAAWPARRVLANRGGQHQD